uniref:Uncharacterized protein n=1 Tax=Ciona savignyi TaxID=51511 RepID=H2YB62_CIOSA
MSLLRNPASTGKYVCSVRNIHGISNVTYVKVTGPTQLIGSLSVAEFVTTLVLCVVFAVILACIIGWLTYKRFSFRKSQEASSDEKSTVRNIRFAESPVPMEEDVREALSVPAGVTRVRVDQSTPSSNIDKYRCYMAVDGSSIEIVENDSLPSPQNCNQMRESPNDDTKRLQ